MKTNDVNESGNRSKMAKIDTFEFTAATNDEIIEDVRREEEARLNNKKGVPPGEREYRFYTTNTVKRVDTQSVHRLNTTTGTGPVYNTTGTMVAQSSRRRTAKKPSLAARLIPLAIIIAHILSVVSVDIIGLMGYYFGLTPVSVVLYVLYLTLTILGTMLMMFMDVLPKPVALLVLFVSIFCVNGNKLLMIPLVLAFIGVAITIEGNYTRIVTCAIAVFMAFYAVVIGVSGSKVTRSDIVESEDGQYQLVRETRDDGKELKDALILETDGTLYKRYVIAEKYVSEYYFTDEGDVAYAEADRHGEKAGPDKVVSIKQIIGK